ncbi:MAG: transcriptional repressor LexA [Caldilineales bacterium]
MKAPVDSLTDLEQRALDFITLRLRDHHVNPSTAEIVRGVGLTSKGCTIDKVLRSLEEKGFIEREPGKARSLRVFFTSDGWPFHLGQTVQVPLKGVIAAGFPIDPQDGLDDMLELTTDLVGDPTNVYALRVSGDSMIEDSVFDGDLVILRHQDTADNGDMVAAWLTEAGETTLKRYYREGRSIRLRAANPRYPDRVEDEARVMVQGKVVAIIRRLA